jgi:hypothetical protein
MMLADSIAGAHDAVPNDAARREESFRCANHFHGSARLSARFCELAPTYCISFRFRLNRLHVSDNFSYAQRQTGQEHGDPWAAKLRTTIEGSLKVQ